MYPRDPAEELRELERAESRREAIKRQAHDDKMQRWGLRKDGSEDCDIHISDYD